ncbi:MAG: CapA family protein [Tannerella sp.]|jgi:poly-gamma-glutamate synthesis protein (capsule biosynthesis protein)|nr:CapA family protein [Tannerella sp.]
MKSLFTETEMKSFILTICVALCSLILHGCRGHASDENIQPEISSPDTVKLIFAGDMMGHSVQTKAAWREGGDSSYVYEPVFQWVKQYISEADIAVANLEVTFAGAPYKGYPTFSSPIQLADALKNTGFDVLMTANNHILDHRVKGLERTLDVLDSLGFAHTGSFKDSVSRQSSNPLIIENKGIRLAFLNYTYGTNMPPAQSPFTVNYIDTLQMAVDLANADALSADFTITFLHWGEEYQTKENEFQRHVAEFLVRHGCDLIVGAHPHVVQPIRNIDNQTADSVLVAYSLGNFVSNQRWRHSDGGIMLEVSLIKTDSITTLDSYRYEPCWVYRYPANNAQVYRLIPVNDYMVHPENYPTLSANDEKKLLQFYEDTEVIMRTSNLEP